MPPKRSRTGNKVVSSSRGRRRLRRERQSKLPRVTTPPPEATRPSVSDANSTQDRTWVDGQIPPQNPSGWQGTENFRPSPGVEPATYGTHRLARLSNQCIYLPSSPGMIFMSLNF
ncbi:uncharacterized protein LOC130047803 [Ostrea edulis]|uniref:uncharacterized protein LOC130047803 n=1 Tax=Ostrea edulis TaxID=37623 RepID=UPI0024AFA592|nr:uncharacterized protein LOC130047803 [Ostrea edulis]